MHRSVTYDSEQPEEPLEESRAQLNQSLVNLVNRIRTTYKPLLCNLMPWALWSPLDRGDSTAAGSIRAYNQTTLANQELDDLLKGQKIWRVDLQAWAEALFGHPSDGFRTEFSFGGNTVSFEVGEEDSIAFFSDGSPGPLIAMLFVNLIYECLNMAYSVRATPFTEEEMCRQLNLPFNGHTMDAAVAPPALRLFCQQS